MNNEKVIIKRSAPCKWMWRDLNHQNFRVQKSISYWNKCTSEIGLVHPGNDFEGIWIVRHLKDLLTYINREWSTARFINQLLQDISTKHVSNIWCLGSGPQVNHYCPVLTIVWAYKYSMKRESERDDDDVINTHTISNSWIEYYSILTMVQK